MFVRLCLVGLTAVLAARSINWAIANWAYTRRLPGPWSAAPKGMPSRGWREPIPVFGWLVLRRESKTHGKWFWLRPLLIELLFPACIVWYYHFYVTGGALTLGQAAGVLQPDLHWQFIGHFVLFALMAIATFIDFDEQSIPDYVTIPGTVIGLIGAALAPAWLPLHQAPLAVVELHANIPEAWPLWLNGNAGLFCGLAILGIWGFGLLDRRWIGRRGFATGVRYFFARMFRNAILWRTVVGVTAVLMVATTIVWWQPNMNPGRWTYLLSSLFGLAFAGGVTWAVRLSASWGLRVEALGFGDVTLMAMIGTYVGWQPSLLIFFIAPLASLIFVVIRWMVTGETATPYGPYLCAATTIVLVYWDSLWGRWAAEVFAIGPGVIVSIIITCVILMGAMLWIWRLIKEALGLVGS